MRLRFTVLMLSLLCAIQARRPKNILPGGGQMWALLVASSTGWYNYRHQADVCHAYQLLHHNGVPDKNIIVMMADDIANHPSNPTPGVIINVPKGPNVYKNVPIDYSGNDVSASNFLNILKGNKTALRGKGSGRVIESAPNDHIFVNIVDHGAPGYIIFPNDKLRADELVAVLSKMAKDSTFAKMAVYVEACEAGSMFDNLLDEHSNIFVSTAADPFEESLACYFDEQRGTFLADLFSVSWLSRAELESLPSIDLHHMFAKVRFDVEGSSHVEEYGDLDMGNTKVSEFIGFRTSLDNSEGSQYPELDTKDLHANRNATMISLEKQIEKERDPIKLKQLQIERGVVLKKRGTVDHVVTKIIQVLRLKADQLEKVYNRSYRLNTSNFPCYKELVELFSDYCFNLSENPYSAKHLYVFVNICNLGWNTVREAHSSIKLVCGREPSYKNFFAV